MAIYKLRGAGTGGTEDSVASLDIQFDGFITACHGHIRADQDADGDNTTTEVSFLSSSTTSVNDTRGSIFMISMQHNQVAADGTFMGSVNSGIAGLRIPVNAGERLHMHMAGSGSIVSTAQVHIYVEDDAGVELRRRR